MSKNKQERIVADPFCLVRHVWIEVALGAASVPGGLILIASPAFAGSGGLALTGTFPSSGTVNLTWSSHQNTQAYCVKWGSLDSEDVSETPSMESVSIVCCKPLGQPRVQDVRARSWILNERSIFTREEQTRSLDQLVSKNVGIVFDRCRAPALGSVRYSSSLKVSLPQFWFICTSWRAGRHD